MISYQPKAIMIKDQNDQIIAELTYFRLPSKYWLLEQLFASSRSNLQKYQGILIQKFFDRVPQKLHSVRVLDPFAKAFLRKHLEYQKYLHQI